MSSGGWLAMSGVAAGQASAGPSSGLASSVVGTSAARLPWEALADVGALALYNVVAVLEVVELARELFNFHVHALEFTLDVSIRAGEEAASLEVLDLLPVDVNLLVQSVALLALVVDLLQQVDVLTHDLLVLLLVDVLILLQHLSQVVNVVLEVAALVRILTVEVSVAGFVLQLFLHVLLVQANNAGLELLEVGDVVQALEDVVLKLLLVALLLVEVLPQVLHFVGETFLAHTEIVDDEGQVLVDTVEVLELLSHLVCLLIEVGDFLLSGANVSLELFNFIIEHELELFKFLSLLLQVDNSLVLILYSSISLLELADLTLDLLFEVVGALEELVQLVVLVFDELLVVVSLGLLLLKVVMDQCQVTLGLHTHIDDLGQFFFVLVF
eukprot:CAMPEP_0170487790 /NCGR_PEP_ID=MMETSP0208-20121228/6521_1 /TAXON_ID=197538 /ORGANISM="Strombidium inclinatum, Strain S3" /LENGTH=383 /DNA_ID=CAMNT_0010762185 /DNA_START=120 /DNA_END=1273 /DNA_ORIENTATION=+